MHSSCTQCVSVGFECKTSDKLSRRAFPRGYTESLEERVRSLEGEVRELKDLLDEKDEKIDMLSRIHSRSPQSIQTPPQPSPSNPINIASSRDTSTDKDDNFKVNQSSTLVESEGSDSYFLGTSSGHALIDAFKNKVQELGKGSIEDHTNALLQKESGRDRSPADQPIQWKAPPRLLSDQFINIFFQEWAPIYPVLHRPTFLLLYEEYLASPEAAVNNHASAQLHLVFGIASQSSQSRDSSELASIESQWRAALDAVASENSMATLQCLTLAQMYCLLVADYSGLLRYKSLAIALSQRLGLHQSQRRFALGTLTSETRKKVFWTLYTLDCFSAAQLGLPRQFRDEDICCEYPVNVDDEYLTEKGFLPTLPGESTRLSSALALFRAARILADVLKQLYPAQSPHEVSFKTVASLSDDLDAWNDGLPSHLRLQFAQDKPSTHIVTSRSPLLALAYQYIRSAIYRPAVCASSALGDRASSSIVAVATAAKRTIQIVQLLNERNLSFSFCVNKNELLISSGFGLLFQCLDLNTDGKLIKDNQRMLVSVVKLVEREKALSSQDLRKIASVVLAPDLSQRQLPRTLSPNSSELTSTATSEAFKNTYPSRSQASFSSTRSEPTPPVPQQSSPQSPASNRTSSPVLTRTTQREGTNLDYLSFNGPSSSTINDIVIGNSVRPCQPLPQPPPAFAMSVPETGDADWARLISSLDQAETNIHDSIYGGPTVKALEGVDFASLTLSKPLSTSPITGQNLVWDAKATSSISTLGPTWRNQTGQYSCENAHVTFASHVPASRSSLSASDDSLTRGEDPGCAPQVMRSSNLSAELAGSSAEEFEIFKRTFIPSDDVSPHMYSSGTPDDLGVLDVGFGL